VIYDGFPHYRNGVIEELARSPRFEYVFFGDERYTDPSIRTYDFRPDQQVVRTHTWPLGPFRVQRGILRNILRRKIGACIFLGNPYFLSYWWLTPLLRLSGRRVYFWTHGWLAASEPRAKRLFRDLFFRLPDGLFLYGTRARDIGMARGFRADSLHVIHNSLDYDAQKRTFGLLEGQSRAELRAELGLPTDARILICTARITRKCRFEILLEAAKLLRLRGLDAFVLLVGEGPEAAALATLAASLGVPHRFWGACYEESMIARLYKAADLTVSPGKVGLTAMHSMAYGTPVISHGNLDNQMPEYESIVPGVTGDFFAEDSVEDLANVIESWLRAHPEKPERECVARIEAEFTPRFQREVIERVLLAEAQESR
jgi:glycosyltransferase involved in cell wall biosynthesis